MESVLLAGKRIPTAEWVTVIHEMVRFEISISRSIHQLATTANLRGWHGPEGVSGASSSDISANLENGNSVACIAGPRPRAAALEMRFKWMLKASGRFPCIMVISCLAALK